MFISIALLRGFFAICLALALTSFPIYAEESKKKSEDDQPKVTIHTNVEIVSNFIWRGIDIGGDALSRRNGEPYKSYTYAPALQPTIDIFSPSKNFQLQLFGSFQLTNRADRDSDKRLFQSGSGGVGPSYLGEETKYWDPGNQDVCAQNMQKSLTNQAGDYSNCGNRVPGKDITQSKEPNGLRRADGLFFAFIYNFDPTNWGTLSAGIWFYNTFNKSASVGMTPGTQTPNAYASGGTGLPYSPNTQNTNNKNAITRLSWHEYFVFWKLPFLKSIEPTFSIYTQYSTENGGYMSGRNYLSFSMSHQFRNDKFFRIQPAIKFGYAAPNNLIDNRNGLQDITGSWTFHFGQFFTRAVGIYRPNLYIWDTNNAYGFAGGDPSRAGWNRTAEDGMVANPLHVYGPVNTFLLNTIDGYQSGNASTDSLLRIYAREKLTLQKIPQYLLYFSFGYTATF